MKGGEDEKRAGNDGTDNMPVRCAVNMVSAPFPVRMDVPAKAVGVCLQRRRNSERIRIHAAPLAWRAQRTGTDGVGRAAPPNELEEIHQRSQHRPALIKHGRSAELQFLRL